MTCFDSGGISPGDTSTGSGVKSVPCSTSINPLKKGVKSKGTLYVKDTQLLGTLKRKATVKHCRKSG